jgi:hypothetical protein
MSRLGALTYGRTFLLVVGTTLALCAAPEEPRERARRIIVDGGYARDELLTLEIQEMVFWNRLEVEGADDDDEMYLFATADPAWDDLSLKFSEDAAAFFKFKMDHNVLFLWRDGAGRAGWEVLRGENVLERQIEGRWVCFAGQGFDRVLGEPQERWKRALVFLVEDLEDTDPATVARILAYYDRLLPFPPYLQVELWAGLDALEERSSGTRLVPPPLTDRCRSINRPESRRSVIYWRYPAGSRRMDVWERVMPSRQLVTREFASLEEMLSYRWPQIGEE